MIKYTGWQYLLIDCANAFGLDKELFETRIAWTETNMPHLERLIDQVKPKDRPLYRKAVMAIRNVLAGNISHDLVSLDACCSGIQVMSALTGCVKGANNTGLVDPTQRKDAYGILKGTMQELLGGDVQVSREHAKDAMMKMFYGSRAEPKAIFGEDTQELSAFYQASCLIAPGAWELLQELVASWRPWALMHGWTLPDGFDVRIKVMVEKDARVKVDELGGASFTYEFKVNEGRKSHVSNAANVVHSVDAYVLRCIQRRCNYSFNVDQAMDLVHGEIRRRSRNESTQVEASGKVKYYADFYTSTQMADVVIVPHLSLGNINQLSTQHLTALKRILNTMVVHNPFPVLTVHDEFKCHPNYMNHLRQHYINIFAEIAESTLLNHILSCIYGMEGKVVKLSDNLGQLIRGSNYALS